MTATQLELLARQLKRPSDSLRAFSRLTPEQLAMLGQAIDAACAQQRQSLDIALRKALPAPLRLLVLWILRGRGA